MLIKVCGMREALNIEAVEALDVDMMGFIFYPKSPRCCTQVPGYLPSCARVGVFVNAAVEEIVERVRGYGLDAVQLHGTESPEFCTELQKALLAAGELSVSLIKALPVASVEDVSRAYAYDGYVDMLIFDTKCDGAGGRSSESPCSGGTGRSFDWGLLRSYRGQLPFLLSGGIAPESVEALKSFRHPRLVGYDLNSRFEDEPGLKNIEKLKNFIQEIQ